MSCRTATWLANSIVALAVLLGVFGCLLLLLDGRLPSPSDMGYTLAFVSFLVVGVLIASRRPENPIGWMFCVIGLASVREFFATEYAFYALVTRPGALPGGVWMAWTEVWTASITWTLMFFALLLFPDGRLPSPRWRLFAWLAAATFTLLSVLGAFEPGQLLNVPNPTGIERAAGIIELGINILIFVVTAIQAFSAPSLVRSSYHNWAS